jgi:DNA-nicking Smr family endonuclease
LTSIPCSQSQEAYSNGDGALAKELSEQGKAHGRKMDEYNKQASEFILRENNADGRVPADTIDLHGQFVEEAEEILEQRIKYAKAHGQTHLHVLVFSIRLAGSWVEG